MDAAFYRDLQKLFGCSVLGLVGFEVCMVWVGYEWLYKSHYSPPKYGHPF